ncbi:hypothetical protein B0H16DRAFT_1856011 [Mycena metata]|uniref:Uncharacterized protein n=1 Tax=Mycena metata TaxID=1033252 RepID=A0AAD7N508_9AGAR|nr:hypothetical protein B0H16DRAFT_1856011 [Mycena metata]
MFAPVTSIDDKGGPDVAVRREMHVPPEKSRRSFRIPFYLVIRRDKQNIEAALQTLRCRESRDGDKKCWYSACPQHAFYSVPSPAVLTSNAFTARFESRFAEWVAFQSGEIKVVRVSLLGNYKSSRATAKRGEMRASREGKMPGNLTPPFTVQCERSVERWPRTWRCESPEENKEEQEVNQPCPDCVPAVERLTSEGRKEGRCITAAMLGDLLREETAELDRVPGFQSTSLGSVGHAGDATKFGSWKLQTSKPPRGSRGRKHPKSIGIGTLHGKLSEGGGEKQHGTSKHQRRTKPKDVVKKGLHWFKGLGALYSQSGRSKSDLGAALADGVIGDHGGLEIWSFGFPNALGDATAALNATGIQSESEKIKRELDREVVQWGVDIGMKVFGGPVPVQPDGPHLVESCVARVPSCGIPPLR